MRRPLVFHPFLLALFPIVFLLAHNIEMVLISEILLPSAVILGFTSLSVFLLRKVLGDGEKAGMVVSMFWVLFFSYGHVFDVLAKLMWHQLGGALSHTALLFAWAILFMLYAFSTVRIEDGSNWTKILNFTAISLVALSVIRVGVYKFRVGRIHAASYAEARGYTETDPVGEGGEDHPDVYYVVLDRYASSSTLEEHFGFDNSEFTNYLTSRGFYIASEARANYPKTFQSLASSLNMKHLTYLTDELGRDTSDQTLTYPMLQDHELWRFLRSRRYRFVHFGSWWEPTRRNRYADVNYTVPLAEFQMMLYRNTILEPLGAKLGLPGRREMQQRAVLPKFEKLAEITDDPGPKFVFAHLLLPHSPYLFGPQGEMLTEEQVASRSGTENYLNQLLFTNGEVKRLIDRILSVSDRPPIIVLQADEGPFVGLEGFGEGVPWNQLSEETLRAHMRIFSAYYLPDADYESVLYPSITPVNSFRIIFDHYFGTAYGLLEDNSYVFEDLEHPYTFIDVTDRVTYD